MNDVLSKISLWELNITSRIYISSNKAGISTVADFYMHLVDNHDYSAPSIRFLSDRDVNTLERHTMALLASVDSEGDILWEQYCKILDIPVVPATLHSPQCNIRHHLFTVLPDILQSILDDREWRIIQRRNMLAGATRLTLQELGEALGGLTRQRIDQLYNKALKKLKDVLIEHKYVDVGCRVHPTYHAVLDDIFTTLTSLTQHEISESSLLSHIGEYIGIGKGEVKIILPEIYFLLALIDVKKLVLTDKNISPILGHFNSSRRHKLKDILTRLHDILTTTGAAPMEDIDVLIHLNKGAPKTRTINLKELEHFITLCSTVERRDDGLVWARFEYLIGRMNQAERILYEEGGPLHADEITRRINHILVPLGHRKLSTRNLVNQMIREPRFVPVGRSGYWALRSWNIDTSTILNLMEKCLIAKNAPLSIDELYNCVTASRPAASVNKKSIIFYLTQNRTLFARVKRDKWGLVKWTEVKAAEKWDLAHVADYVANIFRNRNTDRLPYAVVKIALAEAASVRPTVAQGMLNVNPVIRTARIGNQLFAILQSDYRLKIRSKTPPIQRNHRTMHEQIAQRVREILLSVPNHEILLSKLIDILNDNFHTSQRTLFYGYISKMEFVEKIPVPGTRMKICRLREARQISYPQISKISNPDLRVKVERALQFLNIEYVDIGLFLLSKEFEEVLRRYLSRANSLGKLKIAPTLPEEKWKLDSMISSVVQNGLLTDKATLSFLRQKRNDRAHGTMPPPEELEILMKSAPLLANMYIDYIKYFDDLYSQL